jgi:hypothetical protein
MAEASAEAKRAEIDGWHKKRGWKGFGYHYLIDEDGTVVKGRPETEVGAHVGRYNRGSIGICLVGGHGASKTDPFDLHFTEAQDTALRDLIADIKTRANIKRIRGHSEVANKACPGFVVKDWLAANEELPPLPTKKEVSTAMGQSKKYKVASRSKWVLLGAGGITSGWPTVKEYVTTGQDMIATFEQLLASNGLMVVSGLCIVSAIVFNWINIRAKQDFAEGRYEPSGDRQ